MEAFGESLVSQIRKGCGVPASQNGGEYFIFYRRLWNICYICPHTITVDCESAKIQRPNENHKC